MNSRFYPLLIAIGICFVVFPTFAHSQNANFLSTLNPFWKVPEIHSGDFVFTIKIPIHNSGSVSVIPSGKIVLIDENGKALEKIGIDGARNDLGTLLQTEVVDYIRLNPEGRKIPAGQTVSFSSEWKGFADRFVKDGIPSIEFSSPLGHGDSIPSFALWEKLSVIESTRHFTAQVKIEFRDLIGGETKIQEFSLPLEVPYVHIKKEFNWGLMLIVVVGIGLVLFLVIPRRREIIKEKNQKAIQLLETETKKALKKIKKKSQSGGSGKVKKRVKKIKENK
ncbi:hypothetical protein CSB09_03415 [Candidatus Gracilibacteria bacterium]|nr:MAG: hypothetical protein CSB09_03415 [Candidatus Gracilibacteria bacterium]